MTKGGPKMAPAHGTALPLPQLISASVASCSATLACVAFRVTRLDRKLAEYGALRRALTALSQELAVLAEWSDGYERKSLDEYRTLGNGKYYKDWRRPHRLVFRFNYDSIRGVRQNPPTPDFDIQLLSDLSVLDHAITNLFSLLDRYDRIVQGDAVRLGKLYLKVAGEEAGQRVDYTEEEQEFQEIAFRLNYQIHVDGIGAEEQRDQKAPGLHWAHKKARESLTRVESCLKKPSLFTYDHKSYIVGDTLALVFSASAVAVCCWIVTGLSWISRLGRFIFSCFHP
jgi:hypothetical protein